MSNQQEETAISDDEAILDSQQDDETSSEDESLNEEPQELTLAVRLTMANNAKKITTDRQKREMQFLKELLANREDKIRGMEGKLTLATRQTESQVICDDGESQDSEITKQFRQLNKVHGIFTWMKFSEAGLSLQESYDWPH